MSDDTELSYAEFVKCLVLMLLFEAAACTASIACKMAFSAHAIFGPIASLVAILVLGHAALSNAASMAAARFSPIEEKFRRFARTSFFLTASQTVLVAAFCFSRSATTNAIAAAACLAASLVIYRFVPGEFPPNLDQW